MSQGWQELAGQCVTVEVEGLPPMPWLKRMDASGVVDEAADRAFVKAMLGAGILTRVNHPAFVTAALTDEEIEHAVLDGARTYLELQEKTKLGTVCGGCKDEAALLMNEYIEKHFGQNQ